MAGLSPICPFVLEHSVARMVMPLLTDSSGVRWASAGHPGIVFLTTGHIFVLSISIPSDHSVKFLDPYDSNNGLRALSSFIIFHRGIGGILCSTYIRRLCQVRIGNVDNLGASSDGSNLFTVVKRLNYEKYKFSTNSDFTVRLGTCRPQHPDPHNNYHLNKNLNPSDRPTNHLVFVDEEYKPPAM